MTKRFRKPKMKPGLLQAYYGYADGEGPTLCYQNGGGGADRCDAHLIHGMFSGYERTGGYWEELLVRGYDPTTLKFSISMKVKD